MKYILLFFFIYLAGFDARATLKHIKPDPSCVKKMAKKSGSKFQNLNVQSILTKKYVQATTEDFCLVDQLKKDFSKGKPQYCRPKESSSRCLLRIQKEMIKDAPLSSSGIILFVSVSALEILKNKKQLKKQIRSDEEKKSLLYISGANMIEAALTSIDHMKRRKNLRMIFPLQKKMNLSEIPDKIMAVALKEDGQKFGQFEKEYPFINTPQFEYTIMELIDDIMALQFVAAALNKNISLNKKLLSELKTDLKKLKEPDQLKFNQMLEQKLKLTLEKLHQLNKENSIIFKRYRKYILMSQGKN